jgi:hypothetical protein
MRYTLIKRNGGFDTRLKWEKPVNHKLERLWLMALVAGAVAFAIIASIL